MHNKTRLTTLDEQRRRQQSALEGGRKLLGSCLVGAAIFLFAAGGGSEALSSLAIGCLLSGAGVLIGLRQLMLKPFIKKIAALLLILAGLYFLARGAFALFLLSAAEGVSI